MDFKEHYTQFFLPQQQETTPTSRDHHVLFIDAMNLFIRVYSVIPTADDTGKHIGGITGFFKSLGSYIKLIRPTRVVVVFDGAGGSQRRRKMFPAYKEKRRSLTKINRHNTFATLEDEKDAMKWQLLTVVSMLELLPTTVLSIENVEADDVIAYLATLNSERGNKSTIISTDKDFLQLVDTNIQVYNPMKKKMYHPQQVVTDYGFHPNNFLMYRMVTGDDSDCVPGIGGIKEKTLLKFFPELSEPTPLTITDVVEKARRLTANVKKPPTALQSLLAGQQILERNFALMSLSDVAMSGSTRLDAVEKFDGEINKLSKVGFIKYVTALSGLFAFGDMDTWIQQCFMSLNRYASK